MPFELSEISSEKDLDAISRELWNSFDSPQCKLRQLFFPAFGNSAEARERGIQETIFRQTEWLKADPTSRWIMVYDTAEPNRLLGAALWHIYHEDPHCDESDEDCTWFPEGEERELANNLIGQLVGPRLKYMSKAHACKWVFFRYFWFGLFLEVVLTRI